MVVSCAWSVSSAPNLIHKNPSKHTDAAFSIYWVSGVCILLQPQTSHLCSQSVIRAALTGQEAASLLVLTLASGNSCV